MIQKIKPPIFQGGKGEEIYELFIFSHEILEAVGLVYSQHGRFIAL